VRSFTMSRRTRFLAAGAVMATVAIGGGGLAYAASSGGAPTLTAAHGVHAVKFTPAKPVRANRAPVVVRSGNECPTLVPVRAKSPKITVSEVHLRPANPKLVVCGSGKCPTLVPVRAKSPKITVSEAHLRPANPKLVVCGSGGKTTGR
jgi:hypothetical protein